MDLWGNVNENQIRTEVEVTVDEEAPTVEEITADADSVEITYSEEMDEDTAEDEDNYQILDSDGDDTDNIRNATLGSDGKTVTLDLNSSADDGTYTIEIEDVEDTSGNVIDTVTEEFSLEDNEAPDYPDEVLLETIDAADNEYKLIVEYNEAVSTDGKNSAIDLDKYSISDVNLGKEVADNDDVDASVDVTDDGETIEITVSGWSIDETDNVQIGQIADTEGNSTDFSSDDIPVVKTTTKNITISDVNAVSTTELEAEFSGNLDDVEESDFAVYVGSSAPDADTTLDSDNTLDISNLEVIDSNEVKFTLEEEMEADVNDEGENYYLFTKGNQSENRYGINLKLNNSKQIDDEIAPSVEETSSDVEKVYYDGNVVEITFNENLQNTINKSTFEINGGDNSITDASVEDNVVTITATDSIREGDSVEQLAPIYDSVGNKTTGLDLEVAGEDTAIIDNEAPDQPSIDGQSVAFNDDILNETEVNSDQVVRVSLAGTNDQAVAGDTVDVYIDGDQAEEATLNSTNITDGYVDVTVTSSTLNGLTDADHDFTATVTDSDDNESISSTAYTVEVDTSVPAPDASKMDITDNTTTDADELVGDTGAVEGSATVKVYSDAGLTTQVGTDVVANADGSFTYSLEDNSSGSVTYYVVQVDDAGNESTATTETYTAAQ